LIAFLRALFMVPPFHSRFAFLLFPFRAIMGAKGGD